MIQLTRRGEVMSKQLTVEDEWLLYQVLQPEEAEEFSSLLEVLLPHEGAAYAAARQATALSIDSALVGNLGLRALVLEGLRALRQGVLGGSAFVERSLQERTEIVANFEQFTWFQTILHLVKSDFYNRHIVWREMKYPDLGNDSGYLDKGFDRLPG